MSLKRKILLFLLNFLGINALFRLINRNEAIILWYHGICDDDFTLLRGYDERHVSKPLFRKQLIFLKKRGYNFITMTGLIEKLGKKEKLEKLVVLTFDDGFRNVVENAYPIMKELNAKGCFYLVSSLIDGNELLWTDQVEMVLRSHKDSEFRLVFKGQVVTYGLSPQKLLEEAMKDIKKKLRTLSDKERKEHFQQFYKKDVGRIPKEFLFSTWEQIRQLDKDVLEVGSHTQNHPDCATLNSAEEFRSELLDSKRIIQEKVGYEIRHFCYPAGSFDDEVIRNVKQYGYTSAVTIIPGFSNWKTDRYQLTRISVQEDFFLFKALTSGSYFFMSRLLKILKG